MTIAPIALTVGEPAGIGPEITVSAWRVLRREGPVFFWIGDPDHLPEDAPFAIIDDLSEAEAVFHDALPVLAHRFGSAVTPGTPAASHAQAVIDVIARAVDLTTTAKASALCTCPIHKKALIDGAGFAYPGHTEYLADLAGVSRVAMMLASDELRVVPVTIHIPLHEVPTALTPDLLELTLRITHAALIRDFGLSDPRIVVSGLNPHAGEGGAMGHQDATVIAPVVQKLAAAGLRVTGPHSADTLFHAAARSQYDAAVAMYHDQALIPIKTLDFDRGVNTTLGLPFVRTSPDHGTALDIAGRGIAQPTSLIEALRLAGRMARTRSMAE